MEDRIVWADDTKICQEQVVELKPGADTAGSGV